MPRCAGLVRGTAERVLEARGVSLRLDRQALGVAMGVLATGLPSRCPGGAWLDDAAKPFNCVALLAVIQSSTRRLCCASLAAARGLEQPFMRTPSKIEVLADGVREVPESLEITRPDDWHLHLRDGELLERVVAPTARRFGRAIVMPNLLPAVTTVARALAYRDRILEEVGFTGRYS